MTALTIASWLLTYLIHSTVLLTATWLVSHTLGDRHLQLQETLLRFALIGGLLTTTLQLGLGVRPLAGDFSFESSVSRASSAAVVEFSEGTVSIDATPRISTGADKPWAVALVVTWWLGSVLALLALGRSIFDLRRLLHTRRFRPTGRIIERLAAAMGLRREVRLSTSKAIAVPFATGIRQPEICCPERICDLATEHQTGLFAHELAHLARRDPAWQLFYRFGEAIMCLQPLNRLVRQRLEEIAEHLTDERAVECTGNRLGLARCLVVLSHWSASSSLGVPASAFAAGPRLDRRITRLIGGKMSEKTSPWTVPFVIVLLAAAGLILPAVAPVSADSNLGSDTPITVPEKRWSTAEDAPREAPPEAPSPPHLPAPPDEHAPQPLTAPPVPEAAPAPAAAPTATDLPVAETAPEPVAQPAPPAPAAKHVPASDHQPKPVLHPVQPAQPAPRSPVEEDEMIERARERAERGVRDAAERNYEAQKRAVERAQVEAERQARRAEFQEQRFREAEERAAHAAAAAEERARERACRMAEDRERIAARELRIRERAAVMAKEAAQRAEEHRIRSEKRAIERERVNEERARQLAERARKFAEEAESRLLEERDQKDD